MGEGNVRASTMRSRPLDRPRIAPLAAWVCRRSGHADLFATEPEVLFEHWSAENHWLRTGERCGGGSGRGY